MALGLSDPLPPFFPPADSNNYSGYTTNPYLSYRPIFARSLPIQIFVTGITLTLVSILLIQLLFTAPYHVRLARVNFFLQISAAVTLLASEIACLCLIINDTMQQSQAWPFMLEYIAVDLPPLIDPTTNEGWSRGGLIAWLFMNAMVSALTQITHIQFLSLMYPSRLEAQLIFILLGPLAILAAVTQLAPLHPKSSFVSTASAVRNVCNATLSILFTLSLAIWGFIVNRKQAWRTDGGTAAFGVGAILLALVSTALTIVYIPSRDQFEWVTGLTGAVVLWQSFLGWWWWVGAGMGIGEVDEWLRRAEKRRKRRVIREVRKREQRERLREAWYAISGGRPTPASTTAIEKTGSSTTEVVRGRRGFDTESLPASSKSGTVSTRGRRSSSSSSTHNNESGGYWPWSLARSAYRYVRNAHVSAARRRAIERTEHIRDVFGVEGSPADVPATSGWGLGSFGMREREVAQAEFEMEGVERLEEEEEKVVVEAEAERRSRTKRRGKVHQRRQSETDQTLVDTRSSSMWWWGPLRRWRLQDTTEYADR
ncbi:hypothetical protein B0F90DRAFT_1628704 [Multifurca ochricompacta]|uniref:Uncharacterized protein n=1 Tax=Multifurca ochricompacta TaxID=376703 RepID=A0AAD4M463_9AGAM|nr:hypothetical protein B0F90DRAFT_1628704 [Multifurca ochricompacta]